MSEESLNTNVRKRANKQRAITHNMTFLARAPFSNLRSSLLSVHFWLPEGAKCDSAICLTEKLTVASENVNGVLFRVRDLSIFEIAEARLEALFGG